MDAKEAFEQFKRAVDLARTDPAQKKEMGRLLSAVIEAAGKTKMDVVRSDIASRATIDRWTGGKNIPHPNQVASLRKFLLGAQSDYHSLAPLLLDRRYRPVIEFFLSEETAQRPLNEGQLSALLELAEKSKGTLSPEMMRIFLGLE